MSMIRRKKSMVGDSSHTCVSPRNQGLAPGPWRASSHPHWLVHFKEKQVINSFSLDQTCHYVFPKLSGYLMNINLRNSEIKHFQ